MDINAFISRYDFGKPMKIIVYKYHPFSVAYSGYVVDGKLIDTYGNVVCDDINVIDSGYAIFDFGIDNEKLTVRVSPKNDRP